MSLQPTWLLHHLNASESDVQLPLPPPPFPARPTAYTRPSYPRLTSWPISEISTKRNGPSVTPHSRSMKSRNLRNVKVSLLALSLPSLETVLIAFGCLTFSTRGAGG